MNSYICGELGSHHCYSCPIQGAGIPETMSSGDPSPHPEPCCCHPSAEASHGGGGGKKKREFLGVSSQKRKSGSPWGFLLSPLDLPPCSLNDLSDCLVPQEKVFSPRPGPECLLS